MACTVPANRVVIPPWLCASSRLGFVNGLMAEPYFALREEERQGIRAALNAVGLLNGNSAASGNPEFPR
jgi:hypothetical protein